MPSYDVSYLKLAEQYASFLVALGGVSITVLTLVLAIREKNTGDEKIKSHLYFHIIASLIVATLSCFVGAHLMAETASFTITNSPPHILDVSTSPITYRLFLIASINIYISAILFVFSLVLLPAIYLYPEHQTAGADDELPDKISRDRISIITAVGFILVVVGAWIWMVRSPLVLPDKTTWYWCCAIIIMVYLLYSSYFLFIIPTNNDLPLLPYLFMTLVIMFTFIRFAIIYDRGGITNDFDLYTFCFCVTGSCIFSLELGVRTLLCLNKCKPYLVSKIPTTTLEKWRKFFKLISKKDSRL